MPRRLPSSRSLAVRQSRLMYGGDDFCVTEHHTTGTVPARRRGIPDRRTRSPGRKLAPGTPRLWRKSWCLRCERAHHHPTRRSPRVSRHSRSSAGLPAFQPAIPFSSPSWGSRSIRGTQRDPASIGPCGPWRDPDSNRGHHDFQYGSLDARVSLICRGLTRFLAPATQRPAMLRNDDSTSNPRVGFWNPVPVANLGRSPRFFRRLSARRLGRCA
jgi:hypothetical protein